jgi:peptide/nickel transport system substrate-binding protein
MTDADPTHHVRGIDRRSVLTGAGAGIAAGLAGCTIPGTGGGGGDGTPTPTASLEMPENPPEGGQAKLGLPQAPGTMNPLMYDEAYEYEVVRRLYDFGVALHPTTYEYKPWTFTDWTVNAENAGTSSPTVTATFRDDTEFSDGTAVTPSDYKFTVEYLKEQGVTGSISATQVEYVEDVAVSGDEVEIFLSEAYNGWFGDVLGQIILPEHIWKDVSDYTKYEPRNADEGVVGSGPMVLDEYSWENWFEFSYRDDEVVPWPGDDRIDWIHEDGPFLDGVRLEIYSNQATMQQELMAGNLTAIYQGVRPDTAQDAQETEGITVAQNPSVSYDHVSFNMRRVPFDDVAFRQFLRMLFDGDWVVSQQYDDIGAQRGTYASIASFDQWRPPEPSETDEFEGIPIPDLAFPGSAGSFTLDEDAISAARDFLVDHDEATHDYSFQSGSQGKTNAPDGKQLFVNGDPLTTAHTNNAGENGQGPLEFRYQPPAEDRTQNATGEKYTTALRRVGVPVAKNVAGNDSIIPAVYFQENFDMYSMGWGVTPYLLLYRTLYGEAGVDTGENDTDRPYYNPMGYTGAQDLIDEDTSTMERSERIPIVKQIQAQMWYDAPTVVTVYKNLLEPHPSEFGGFYTTAGGLFETPWMNVYTEGAGD